MARYDSDVMTLNYAGGAAELVPDIIIPEVTASASRIEVFMNLARRYDRTGPGEVFTIPTAPEMSFATLNAGTYIDGAAPEETIFNTGERSFTPRFYFLDVTIGIDVKDNDRTGGRHMLERPASPRKR